MELMNLPTETKFKLKNAAVTMIPPSSISPEEDEIYTMDSLDGMYCNALDSSGNRVYFAAWTKVEVIEQL